MVADFYLWLVWSFHCHSLSLSLSAPLTRSFSALAGLFLFLPRVAFSPADLVRFGSGCASLRQPVLSPSLAWPPFLLRVALPPNGAPTADTSQRQINTILSPRAPNAMRSPLDASHLSMLLNSRCFGRRLAIAVRGQSRSTNSE